MGIDPRTPVLVGAGQVQADGDAPDPVLLLAEAAREAGSPRVLAGVDSVRVVRIVSRGYPDPGQLLAEELGIEPRETVYTHHGGQNPQALVSEAAWDISRGAADLVLIGGAESWHTRRAYKRKECQPPWLSQDRGKEPSRMSGVELTTSSDHERTIGFAGNPVEAYPLFEVAHQALLGRSADAHLQEICGLWSRFSEVAATNPYARLPEVRSAEDIAEVRKSNRMVGYPYRKLLVANDDVDQAAALIVCSVERARALGIPRDEWLFLHGSGLANDTPHVSTRIDLSRSRAIAVAGATALGQAGVGIDDVAHIDLYSCFPCAVEIAAYELGIDTRRQLTVTGGLTFAGGPWNNYTTHAIATMRRLLLEDEGSFGLCSANGGLLTKHAIGVYSTRVPEANVIAPTVWQAGVRAFDPHYAGKASIETYTVMHDRTGAPTVGFVACRIAGSPRRTMVVTQRDDALSALLDGEQCGRTIDVGDGAVTAF